MTTTGATRDDDERAALEEAIERDTVELREAVGELKTAVRAELALGRRIADNPLPWILGCFAVGVWLGRPGT